MATILRGWTKDGYHRDLLIIDEQQVRMHCDGMQESAAHMIVAGLMGPRMYFMPKDFPEVERFEIIVVMPTR